VAADEQQGESTISVRQQQLTDTVLLRRESCTIYTVHEHDTEPMLFSYNGL